jgi:hypothetical protein
MTRQAKKGTSPRGDKVRHPGMWMIGVVLLYGPEQAWFDKTWRPSELELVE